MRKGSVPVGSNQNGKHGLDMAVERTVVDNLSLTKSNPTEDIDLDSSDYIINDDELATLESILSNKLVICWSIDGIPR